jgi:hypothetical protein
MTKPRGLKARGSALYRDITENWEIPLDLRPVLEHACRTADDLDRLQRALADGEDWVVGSTGQAKPNPLFAEVRAHRALLAKLLQTLDLPELPDEAGQTAPSARSEKAARAAHTRWDNIRAIRDGISA